jgi:hypothetical protein
MPRSGRPFRFSSGTRSSKRAFEAAAMSGAEGLVIGGVPLSGVMIVSACPDAFVTTESRLRAVPLVARRGARP